MKFRGGTTTELYIDTDGSLVAGNGDVILDSDGIALAAGTGTPNKYKVMDGSDIIMHLYGNVDAGSSQVELIAEGKDSGDPDAILTMQAITYNGSAQNYVQCDTNNDVVVASATTLRGFKVCRLTGITTTQRNALTAINGMIIYNSTTNTFQGRAGGAWVDLH
ncbi:MAG TPA: hypothetical protein DEP47_09975 [Chloroflexi bacterium]|nr:hypothetical protein [Chloroflexota bacterium]